MNNYLFSRIINKKCAINKYGKMGFRDHKEIIIVRAPNKENALYQIAPFNYKKHIRFSCDGTINLSDEEISKTRFNEIIDLGIVEYK